MNEFCLKFQCGEGWFDNKETKKYSYSHKDYLDPKKFQEAQGLIHKVTRIYYANGADLQVSWDVCDTTILGKNFLYYQDASQSECPKINRLIFDDLDSFKEAVLYSYFGENQIGSNPVSDDMRKKVYASSDCKNFQEIGLVP